MILIPPAGGQDSFQGGERNGDVTPPVRGLLPLPHVQFWEAENSWRLDSSHRGGHRRDIPCLVDASDVRTVNALKPSGVVDEWLL